ncbi:MAG: DUF2922 domain-containing protein [Liquorilactobacillus hordei]|uniref:DUF2922 domain-containing protein n=2 Tax=Liquorilactobacillus hordei TaxID=468911 RepID=A0A0R1MQG1_9LACO|nr:DUF2922 domain-containing protein [Liquorilactobacillus hordei]AUJ29515.1 hypothetical protein BSQ49_04485 [Liquorilactobacillus hordei]KRL07461.1 hypothetical protein FC92_GL001850 [Liquorilactobacillus hordei DSM 19519]QYH52225.1 DUF2922 domain-containing protein [Liquorilactobacillus hordei DSM 19519]
MKQLDMVFGSQSGKTKNHFRLSYANNDLDKEVIKKAMNDLAELGIFVNKNGEELYTTPISAKYVETTNTPIFE